MKHPIIIALAAALASCAAPTTKDTQVQWSLVGNDGTNYTQRIVVTGDMDFDKLAFNMFARRVAPVDSLDTITEIVPGYYAISSRRFAQGADTVVIDLVTPGAFYSRAYVPDGFHRIEHDQTTTAVHYTRLPLEQQWQWAAPGRNDRMPYGDAIYDRNERLATDWTPGIYDIVPSYKSATLQPGTSTMPLAYAWQHIENANPEYYTITVRDDSLIVGASTEAYAQRVRDRFEHKVLAGAKEVPNVVIVDYPDYPYRGLMIDIARNYQTPQSMRRIIDVMADYGLNVLHFHMVDDEAWRLEIPSLPELTQVGSRRGYTLDESDYLAQIFCGDGNPDNLSTPSNGYFTRQDYIDLLRYAQARGIAVIPEIESPGHARAAIKAMEHRYRQTGDDTYRLIHDGDTSEYSSAQAFHDNVMNPALPGPYKFMETVAEDIKAMHAEAGVPLLAIHIGGDEVAAGAWEGSETTRKFMAEHGLDSQTALHGYFVTQVARMLRDKGIPVSGWQEIAIGHTDDYNAEIAPSTFSVNCWTNSGGKNPVNERAINAGFPVVVSNVDYFYMDMAYNYHPEEGGLTWGGTVDEFDSLHGIPSRLCPTKGKGKVIGVSGQLWAETMRSPQMMQTYLLPKMLGMAERGWNNDSTYSDAQFNAVIGLKEMGRWSADSSPLAYHLAQPGIKVIDGRVHMNSPYPLTITQIWYTTDGTDPKPGQNGTLYAEPFDLAGATELRARLVSADGTVSLPSYLYIR